MNILDEITVSYDLDSKILCDTPAKLKLREKTLKGINFSLNDENSTIPALMLAKKKKKKKDDEKNEEQVQEEVVVVEEKEYTGVDISDMNLAETDATYDETRKLRVSQEKKEAFSVVGQELVNLISAAADLGYNEEPVNVEAVVPVDEVQEEVEPVVSEDMNVVETYSVEEIPIEITEPVIDESQETYENVELEVEPVAEIEVGEVEEPEFKVEQGEEGIVASVDTVEIPVVEETVEVAEVAPEVEAVVDEVPNVEEANTVETALDKANTIDAFAEANVLMQEIAELKRRGQEKQGILAEKRELYQNTVAEAEELDKTYVDRKQQAEEMEKQFYEAVERQKTFYADMKKNLQEKEVVTDKEIEDYDNRTAVLKEENGIRLEQINEEDEKIVRFQSLIDSVQSLDNSYEEEAVKVKAA